MIDVQARNDWALSCFALLATAGLVQRVRIAAGSGAAGDRRAAHGPGDFSADAFARRKAQPRDSSPFGYSWFLPMPKTTNEVLRHRLPWR